MSKPKILRPGRMPAQTTKLAILGPHYAGITPNTVARFTPDVVTTIPVKTHHKVYLRSWGVRGLKPAKVKRYRTPASRAFHTGEVAAGVADFLLLLE